MANEAASGLKFNFAVITSLDGENEVDISNIILQSDYYEDILSPCVTMSVTVLNTTSLYNFLPIRGGEQFRFSIDTAGGEFTLDGEYSMYVFKVSNINPRDTNEYFTIHFTSFEGLSNEKTRCLRKYSGNLKTTVESILTDDLQTNKFDSSNIEQTSNSYSFIGNIKKPFRVLTWLSTKGLPVVNGAGGNTGDGSTEGEAKGTAGFFFWENKDGFNFKSIESLVSNTQIGSGSADNTAIQRYTYTGASSYDDLGTLLRILDYSIEKNIDLLKALRVGMYVNKTYFYDYYSGICKTYIYKLKEQINLTLGTDNDIALSDELGEGWTRQMVRIADTGVLDNTEELSTPSGRDAADMAKSAARYNLLFTQSLNMTVPCNVTLKAGDIVYCEFKVIKGGSSGIDEQQSGNYLISQLRHHFEGNQMVTSLKLIRDSYGVYGTST